MGDFPQNTYRWYVEGENLYIVDISVTPYTAPKESIDEGILIHHSGYPQPISSVNDYPELPQSLHPQLVDLLLWKRYEMEAAKVMSDKDMPGEERVAASRQFMFMANIHKTEWRKVTERDIRKKITKLGGRRAFIPRSLRG